MAKLRADLRSYNLDVPDHKAGSEEVLLERAYDFGGSNAIQLIHRVQDAAALLVAEVVDCMRDLRVARLSIRAQMHGVFLHEPLLKAGFAGIVQVQLAGRGLRLESSDDGVLALV